MKSFFIFSSPRQRGVREATLFMAGLCLAVNAIAQSPTTPETAPAASKPPEPVRATPTLPATPPQAKVYVRVRPGMQVLEGHTLAPVSFLKNELGVAVQTVIPNKQWRLSYFEHTIDVFNGQRGTMYDGNQDQFPTPARVLNNNLYVPWTPIATFLGFKWGLPSKAPEKDGSTLMLLQFPAAYIEDIRHSVSNGKIRIVMDLSNPTRVTAQLRPNGVILKLAAARRAGVPGTKSIGDIAVPSAVITSGNWKATTQIKQNYAAPASWYTLDNPPRIVVDVQKIFERAEAKNLGGGLTVTKIFRGTGHGPVRLFLARVDPKSGWRVRIAPAGHSVLQRQRISHIASRSKAPIAVNGGFFAFDGAAVGAVKVNGEWIRLPWKGRSAIAFKPDGEAKIGNLQVRAEAVFSSGLKLPIRDLNGWPDRNRITALTRRFANFVKLRSGEIGAVVENGVVTSTPGSGGVNIPINGFVLVANGGAIPELQKARRGLKASLQINATGWNEYSSALGGGPRLVTDGTAEVKEEGFRSDVTNGLGPRTAMGIDSQGRYIIVVADGRQGYYSTGLTLQELAYTMQKFGAVDAINLDGGGSTAMVVRNRLVNRPSDGSERRVSNALLVMR